MEQFLLNLLKTSLLGALAILLMLVSKPLWRATAPRRAAGCGWRSRRFCSSPSTFR